jgi:type VI secretion system protein ImpE
MEHFSAGRLKAGIAEATERVKKSPSDEDARGDLIDLLLFAGELERADKHLEAITPMDPKKSMNFLAFRQLIRAEQARQQFYSEGRVPEFRELPTERIRLLMEATILLREKKHAEAGALVKQANSMHPDLKGKVNGRPFDGMFDLDAVTAGVFEILAPNGKFYWVPMETVVSLEFTKPAEGGRTMRDLLWRAARLVTADGSEGDVYMPAIYYGSHQSPDEAYALGLASDWQASGEGGPFRGVGQRMFSFGDEEIPVMELQSIEFTRAG